MLASPLVARVASIVVVWDGALMDLKTFVSETLGQIIEGVVIAQKSAAQHQALVNPEYITATKTSEAFVGHIAGGSRVVQYVKFDVAVTAADSKEAGGGISVTIAPFSAGAKGKSTESETSVSRIQFGVAIILPEHKWIADR